MKNFEAVRNAYNEADQKWRKSKPGSTEGNEAWEALKLAYIDLKNLENQNEKL